MLCNRRSGPDLGHIVFSKNLKIGPPVGRRQAGEPMWMFSRLESGRNPAGLEALVRNIGHLSQAVTQDLAQGVNRICCWRSIPFFSH